MNVAILGASRKPDRYSFKALKMLQEKGHVPFPVHPSIRVVEDFPVFPSLAELPERCPTVTVYLAARNSNRVAEDLLNCGAERVIFNPGAENPELETRLKERGVEVLEACTLVMLSTDQF